MVAQVLETTRNLSKGPARRLFATTAVRFEPAPAGNGFDLTLPNSALPDVPARIDRELVRGTAREVPGVIAARENPSPPNDRVLSGSRSR